MLFVNQLPVLFEGVEVKRDQYAALKPFDGLTEGFF